MSYYDYMRKGTLRQSSIAMLHKELLKTKGAYWRPYSFYTAMNVLSSRPTGRATSVHIHRNGNYRTQDKTLCGLIICEKVEDFDYNSPRLCNACRKADLAVEQTLLDTLRRMGSLEPKPSSRTYLRDGHGCFATPQRAKRR